MKMWNLSCRPAQTWKVQETQNLLSKPRSSLKLVPNNLVYKEDTTGLKYVLEHLDIHPRCTAIAEEKALVRYQRGNLP